MVLSASHGGAIPKRELWHFNLFPHGLRYAYKTDGTDSTVVLIQLFCIIAVAWKATIREDVEVCIGLSVGLKDGLHRLGRPAWRSQLLNNDLQRQMITNECKWVKFKKLKHTESISVTSTDTFYLPHGPWPTPTVWTLVKMNDDDGHTSKNGCVWEREKEYQC